MAEGASAAGDGTQPARRSVNRRIFSAAVAVGVATVAVRLLGLLKERAVAGVYGPSDDLEAFLVALNVVGLLCAVPLSSFQATLLPGYVKARRERGDEAALKLLQSALFLLLAGILVTMLTAVATSRLWLGLLTPGWSPEKRRLSVWLLLALTPMTLLQGQYVVSRAVLSGSERFVKASLAAAALPLVTWAAVAWLPHRWGAWPLVLGSVGGMVLQTGLVSWQLHGLGQTPWPRFRGIDEQLAVGLRQFLPATIGNLVNGASTLVDGAFAASLGSGSLAVLQYGNRLVGAVCAVLVEGLATSLLPYMSQMAAKRDTAGLKRTVRIYALLSLAIAVPLAAAVVWWSEPIVRLFFQHGKFGADTTHEVARIQAFYALQIPAAALGQVFMRTIFVTRQAKQIVWLGTINLAVNCVTDYIFMRWLGAPGIALSTGVVYCCSAAIVGVVAVRSLKAGRFGSEDDAGDEAATEAA